ncbi:MAG: hypothetical protein RSF75_01395, partial [Acidaminococcaceae bacterium]
MYNPRRSPEENIKLIEATYTQAAKQCGVTIWMFDFASRTIYDLNNSTRMKIFDTMKVIPRVPEVFTEAISPLHKEDVPAFMAMFDKVLAGEPTAKSVGRWWDDNHEFCWWYEIAYTTIFDELGKPFKAIGTAIDIS